jgi:signal transduction histidine kinase
MSERPLRVAGYRLLAVLILVIAPSLTPSAQDQNPPKRILALFSTRRDSEFSLIGANELPRVLDRAFDRNIDFYSEFIDLSRFPESAYADAFRNFLQQKYQGTSFDLVVAMQDAALEFVENSRDTLFRSAPIVFLSNVPATVRPPHATGVIHERNFAATLDLIRQLQPDVQQVFVVTGAAPADKAYEAAARRQLQPGSSLLKVEFLSGLATKALEDRLSRLPAHSAVYHLLVTQDGAGDKYHPLEYVDKVASAANAPTYSWVDSTLGHGVVGGSLYSQKEIIDRVAELAVRVLRGEPAASIPVAHVDANANQVDWRQLRRWDIDEARVPAGTTVGFRDLSLWVRYRNYILAALAVLVTQAVLIAGLLIHRARRRRAEAQLRVSKAELLKSYERNRDIGARLLKMQDTERSRIARELHDDICQRMLLLTIELQSLSATGNKRPAEALDIAQNIAKSLHELSHGLHPAALRMVGLTASIERLCTELSRTGTAITCTHSGVPAILPSDVMLCLFRVVQESLQNAIKYSSGSEVFVNLSGGHDLTLTVVDNGMGFDLETAWGKGVGLLSMVERLEAIGGLLDIVSTPGGGTQVSASVPAAVLRSAEQPA